MAIGTKAGLLREARPRSVYKHAILDQYMIRFATMTASHLTPRRCVLVDGFAGRGKHADGSAASAVHMMLAAQKAKSRTQIDVFLVEESKRDFEALDAVADEYRQRGLTIETRLGDCGVCLPEILALARGASLFLFLDPCGATLPWTDLEATLNARPPWPRTEALLNFSADLTRRAAGQVKAGQMNADGVRKLNEVCGGRGSSHHWVVMSGGPRGGLV
jgi:three-Cys-motif partner protein